MPIIQCMSSSKLAARPATKYPAKVAGKFKPANQRKDSAVQLRLTADQHRAVTKLAEEQGLSVSTWLRLLVIRELKGKANGGK